MMCIPHGATTSKSNGYVKEKKKRSVTPVSKAEFEHGDPDFVDERIVQEEEKMPSSFFETLFGKK